MSNGFKKKALSELSQLLIPLTALAVLVLFNLFRDVSFFSFVMRTNNSGNLVLAGNLISIIDSASELVIISMGMTLVTAACGGQDISVGAVGAIAGSVFVKVVMAFGSINAGSLLVGLLCCCLVTILFKLFNGTLVAVFNIQPMIATLILYSCVPVPTPIFIVILVGVVLGLVFRFTNIRLYTQSVGINQGAARLNGINPTAIKLLSFVLLGVCVSVASVIGISRLGQLSHKTLLVDIEMDAILAVAIGGNNLGGGKFKLSGTILGAYIIQMLTTTLNAMKVDPVNIKAYKAIVIIIIVVAGSPVVKEKLTSLWKRLRSGGSATGKEVG